MEIATTNFSPFAFRIFSRSRGLSRLILLLSRRISPSVLLNIPLFGNIWAATSFNSLVSGKGAILLLSEARISIDMEEVLTFTPDIYT